MWSLFRPKEVSAVLTAIDAESKILGHSAAFIQVSEIVKKNVLKNKGDVVRSVQSGTPATVVALCEIANVSGDLVESGSFHIYRGILGLYGQTVLDLYISAMKRLVDVGAMSQDVHEKEIAFLKANIQSVG
jgi:hypothetical protein